MTKLWESVETHGYFDDDWNMRFLALSRIGAIVVLISLSTSAYSQSTESKEHNNASILYDLAEANYRKSEFEKARVLYEKSYKLNKDPKILLSIAQCFRSLGKLTDAITSYESFVETTNDEEARKGVNGLLAKLRAEQEAKGPQKKEKVTPPMLKPPAPPPALIAPSKPPVENEFVKAAPPPMVDETEFYKTWTFWTGVVLVGAAVSGTAVMLLTTGSSGEGTLGSAEWR